MIPNGEWYNNKSEWYQKVNDTTINQNDTKMWMIQQ